MTSTPTALTPEDLAAMERHAQCEPAWGCDKLLAIIRRLDALASARPTLAEIERVMDDTPETCEACGHTSSRCRCTDRTLVPDIDISAMARAVARLMEGT